MNELQHHGVKGMKWGVRRYQKKDGTLTPAGKKRYSDSVSEAKANLKTARKEYSDAIKNADAHRLRAFHPKKSERDANTKRWENVAEKGEALRAAKIEYKKQKAREDTSRSKTAVSKESITERGQKAAKKVVKAYGRYKLWELSDQLLTGGKQKAAVEAVIKTAGRAAISAYYYAKGHRDIRWYDN